MTQQSFSEPKPQPLTQRETDLLKTVRTHLNLECETTFTTDTMRLLGFDRFMPKDSLGRINYGVLLRKWLYYNHIEKAGWTRSNLDSNHGRQIQQWRMKP